MLIFEVATLLFDSLVNPHFLQLLRYRLVVGEYLLSQVSPCQITFLLEVFDFILGYCIRLERWELLHDLLDAFWTDIVFAFLLKQLLSLLVLVLGREFQLGIVDLILSLGLNRKNIVIPKVK